MIRLFAVAAVFVAGLALGLSSAPAQTSAAGESSAALGDWPLETVRTRQGTVYRGYIQSLGPHELEIVEVHRPPGKDMHLVVRPVPAGDVVSSQLLPEDERKQLAQRINAFRQRMRIEAGAIESVQLRKQVDGARQSLIYDGPWFRLVSTSEEETTRRAVVRIEQVFRAYRNSFPPRGQPKNQLSIFLYGSMEEYGEELQRKELDISHPAFFSSVTNTILAGADLTHYAERLNRIRAENQRIAAEYAVLNAAFPQRKRKLAEQLRQLGYTSDEIGTELAVLTKAWEDEFNAKMRNIDEVNRRNTRAFQEISHDLFARLQHEAFHAYVENYLFPQREYAFPRWLNEGLAQVFENARIEGEALRVDAPDFNRRRQLAEDLASVPLPLADLLTAEDDTFLVMHNRAVASQRRYLYSWGLAWHLLHSGDLTKANALENYIAQRSKPGSPIDQFEQLVGKKLPEFESAWRAAMVQANRSQR